MFSRLFPGPIAAILIGLSGPASPQALAAEAPASSPAPIAYRETIVPLMERYCYRCHGSDKPKAGLDLSSLDEDSLVKRRKTWELVHEYMDAGSMPPPERKQPTEEELELLLGWIGAKISESSCDGEIDPGNVTLRRLNRVEYNNTIRDLVGVDFRPADDFPSDDVGYGFDNIGDVLTLSPILFEKYADAAGQVAGRAIVVGDRLEGPTWKREGHRLLGGRARRNDGWLISNGELSARHDFPEEGDYRIRVRAYGQQAGPDPARMEIRLDGKSLKELDVRATEAEPETFEIVARIGRGAKSVGVAFTNDFYQADAPDPSRRDRNLIVEWVEVEGPLRPAPLPDSHRRLMIRTPGPDGSEADCAREILERFASRAYRRPASKAEVDRLVGFVELARRNGDSFEAGIQLAVEAALVSPHFLFKVETNRRSGGGPIQPLGDFELATRLSYFLWSTMPDEALFSQARRGKLRDPEVLEAEARRMLADPKARALTDNFATQWLQIGNLRTFQPDPARFPGFDESLRAAMIEETSLFFESIVRDDRSVLELLNADYTFLNARLARHYGISGVEGEHFRRVALSARDRARGGILTQASVLAVTSNPTRTSPVKRGKWILEQVLGAPPPPPPPDVPELMEEEAGAALSGTLRERMEQHRADLACASCHQRMDPLGFGLENFDAVGAWRDREGPYPIDASGVLPSGESFEGPAALKGILAGKADQFTRCLAEKMLIYALGRGLDYNDHCALDEIAADLAAGDNRFSALVTAIVRSEPFTKKNRRGK